MSSTSSSYHIPFPTAFLPVNTPVQKNATPSVPVSVEPEQPHGFLSNRPYRHQSKASTSSVTSVAPSEASTTSVPSSPATRAVDSPVLGPAIFAPLVVNTKHALPPTSANEMTAAERERRLSFEKSTFLSNRH